MKSPRITKLADGRKNKWRLAYWEGGKRKTRHFSSKAQAEDAARELATEQLAPDLALTGAERALFARLRAAAAAAEISTAEAVEKACQLIQRDQRPSTPSGAAIEKYLDECRARNLRRATVQHYEYMLRSFQQSHPGPVAEIEREQVQHWLCSTYKREESRKTARTPIMAWLRWCGRRGWADPERWRDAVSWERTFNDSPEICIIRPAVLRILLRRLPPHHRFPLALLCFTGVRPKGEMGLLRWRHIDLRTQSITIPAAVSKIRQRRVLEGLPPIFWEWAEWEREQGRGSGRVLNSTYDNFRKALRAAACPHPEKGWGPVDISGNDATRHSFATYGFYYFGLEKTVDLMGHVAGFGLFSKRYKGVAGARQARLWFGIRPFSV